MEKVNSHITERYRKAQILEGCGFLMVETEIMQILGIGLVNSQITEKVWENSKDSQVTSF